MALLMDYTDVGRTRIDEIWSDDLVFEVTHVAYGTDGYDPFSPETPLALVPAAVALGAETFRKEVAAITRDEVAIPRGKDTVYTTVGGEEFNDIIGEAGLIATVTDPGTTGLSVGDEFLLAHAHFGRVVFTLFDRLSIQWPLDLQGNILAYTGASIVVGNSISLTPVTGAGSYGVFALTAGSLPSGVVLNPATGEISGTPDVAALLGGSPTGVYSGIEITADGTVVSKPITINVLGVALPAPSRLWSLDDLAVWVDPNDPLDSNVLIEDTGGGNNSVFNTAVPGAPGSEGEAFSYAGSEYTEILDSADVRVGSGDFVIAAFLRQAAAAGASGNYVASKGSIGVGGIRYSLNLTSLNEPSFQIDDNTVDVTATGAAGSTDGGAFHTIAGQRTGTDIELYVDGALVDTQAIGAYGSLDNARPFILGAIYDEGAAGVDALSRFDGDVDTVALWVGTDLTAEQHATLEWLRSSVGRSVGQWIGGTRPGAPQYSDQSVVDGAAITPISPTVPAADDSGSVTYFPFSPLTNGLSLNPVNGELTGTPVLSIGSGAAASISAPSVAAGTLVTLSGAAMTDGDSFVLDDGVNDPVTYEFDDNGSVVQNPTLRAVAFTGADTADDVRDAIITAITNTPAMAIAASNGGAATVTLTNTVAGARGNRLIPQSGSSLSSITDMAGGVDIVVTGLAGMSYASVGRTLIVGGVADPLNAGTFTITRFNDATSVDIDPVGGAGVAPGADANNGALTWTERDPSSRTVRVAVTDGVNMNVSDPFIINVF